eukprot:SAG11_NODE_33902_length_274_cov_12.708571_1_plen_41_part_01
MFSLQVRLPRYPLVFLEEAVWAPPLLKSAIGQVTRFHDGLD